VSEETTEQLEAAPEAAPEAQADGEEHGEVIDDELLDAEEELARRMAIAQVRQWGDPVLRLRAHEVTAFDDELARLAERMAVLMHDARGIGLAATQIGILRRLFVFQAGEDEQPVAVVNPVITASGGEPETGDEGCLSLQRVLVPVERPTTVTLEGKDISGSPLKLELEGLGARVAQHELDHLDGVLIIDRTDRESRREALKALRPKPSLD
jgi:peptide deformylase